MSYDLDVRSDARYSKALPAVDMAAIVGALPGVTRLDATEFVLDQMDAGIHVSIDLTDERPDSVNSVGLSVPYPFLDKSGPVALEMAFQIAEKCGWSVYDPQGDCVLTRETSGKGLKLQQSSGAVARTALERAAQDEAAIGELFGQEMWNHSLVSVVLVFGGVTAAAVWFMFWMEWPREDFGRYLPFVVAIGGVACLWLKGFAQAYIRRR